MDVFCDRVLTMLFCPWLIGILISFICTVAIASTIFSYSPALEAQQSITWIQFDSLTINFGYLVNPLAIMMMLVVTGVGSAIFIYSKGYMADDPSMPKFFAFLSLFAFSMIGIVLANNFIQLFIFWELVGLSSYLLIIKKIPGQSTRILDFCAEFFVMDISNTLSGCFQLPNHDH
jgi:NADH-quinone oxidoreductase subunit L